MLTKVKAKICIMMKTFFSLMFCLCPIKKNKIVLESFGGKNFSDNPKMIALEIVKQKKPWDVVWLSIDRPSDLPKEIRWVKYGTIKALHEWGTSRVWIDNIRHQVRPIKRKGQYYIQTWHGPFPIKCIEKYAEDKLDKDYVKSAKKDGRLIDAIVSSDKLLDETYKEAFWLNDNVEFLRVGAPRNDRLFTLKNDKKVFEKVRETFCIPPDAFVVLYAPTFRDDRSTNGYLKSFEQIVESFEKEYNKKTFVLVRMHPSVSNLELDYRYNDKIINASDYSDAQELSLATNCVISDYSSIIYDYAFLNKPVFLCALDIEHYNELRGLRPIIYELPFSLATSLEELIENIKCFNEERYYKRVSEFFQKYPFYDDGDASKKVVEKIQTVLTK